VTGAVGRLFESGSAFRSSLDAGGEGGLQFESTGGYVTVDGDVSHLIITDAGGVGAGDVAGTDLLGHRYSSKSGDDCDPVGSVAGGEAGGRIYGAVSAVGRGFPVERIGRS
jgi:hypothetical protein